MNRQYDMPTIRHANTVMRTRVYVSTRRRAVASTCRHCAIASYRRAGMSNSRSADNFTRRRVALSTGRPLDISTLVSAEVSTCRQRVYIFTIFGDGFSRALFDAYASTIDLRPEEAASPVPS